MNVSYLSDDKGNITGVFIPIAEWERLQQVYHIRESVPADSATKLQQSLTAALQKAKPDEAAQH